MDNQLSIQLGKALLLKGWTVGTAESCTGGRIASLLTAVPGSSAYFTGGIVAYSNQVKENILGVLPDDLIVYGAVSHPVVEQMALGAIRVLGCECAMATSGVAGPTGGTPEKPVGTVWVAVAVKDRIEAVLCHFVGDREEVIRQSAVTAMQMLLALLTDSFVNE